MKDKEMIEEMAKIIDDCTDIIDEDYCDNITCDKCRARRLYNLGYRKVKDSVVLSKEEYEKLQNENKQLFYRNSNLILENKNLKEDTEIEVLKASKETAEKDFSTIIKALEERKERVHSFYGVSESVGVDIAIKTVKELAKQFGVEIKE